MEPDFSIIIKDISKLIRKAGLDYDQFSYVAKEVRKELELKPPKRNRRGTVKRMSNTQLAEFLNAAYRKSALEGLMMDTLYETAMRVSELCAMDVSDVHPHEHRMTIRVGKGGIRREVYFTDLLRSKLMLHIGARKKGPLFLSVRGGAFSARSIQVKVKQIAEMAGIQGLKVTPHTLRHTRATLLAEAGMEKDYLQVLLGHADVKTTEEYTYTAALPVRKSYIEASQALQVI